MEKDWNFLIENRFQNRDRKFFDFFQKFRKNQDFSIFHFFPKIFWKISIEIQLFSIFDFSKIFEKNEKIEKIEKILIFSKFSKIFRSRFRNRFSIKNFQSFSMIFFLNRYRINWRSLTWRLEVLRTQCGRVKNRNVWTGAM